MNEGHEVSAAWAADLRDMGAALDLSPAAATELADTLQAFFRDASVAVRSLIGMTLTCRLPDGDAVLTALRPTSTPDEIAASLQIRLPLPGGPAGADCLFVLYADRPGAFAALADGLLDALGTDSGELVLDQHLEPQASSDVSAFRHAAVHDMAEGVLLGRGFSEIGAATFIEALTAASDGDADGAARQVIRSVR
jgi:hypothetical protein